MYICKYNIRKQYKYTQIMYTCEFRLFVSRSCIQHVL